MMSVMMPGLQPDTEANYVGDFGPAPGYDVTSTQSEVWWKPALASAAINKHSFGPYPEGSAVSLAMRHVLAAPRGARYCAELDAFVPSELQYTMRPISAFPKPVKGRFRKLCARLGLARPARARARAVRAVPRAGTVVLWRDHPPAAAR